MNFVFLDPLRKAISLLGESLSKPRPSCPEIKTVLSWLWMQGLTWSRLALRISKKSVGFPNMCLFFYKYLFCFSFLSGVFFFSPSSSSFFFFLLLLLLLLLLLYHGSIEQFPGAKSIEYGSTRCSLRQG